MMVEVKAALGGAAKAISSSVNEILSIAAMVYRRNRIDSEGEVPTPVRRQIIRYA